MRVKCEYCGGYIDDSLDECPNCGAPNLRMMRGGDGVPTTIEEMLAFAEAHGIPLERIRFFVGTDCREPKAFGIYRDDDGNFVVYKNKADGTRSIRYRGTDEAYAVNEIYQKLRSETNKRSLPRAGRAGDGDHDSAGSDQRPEGASRDVMRAALRIIGIAWASVAVIMATIAVIIAVAIASGGGSATSGTVYHSGGVSYYEEDGSWWADDSGAGTSWTRVDAEDVPESVTDAWESSEGDGWSSSDWDDDDWDVDWDSWDSSDTDWDSDW